ncbi:MAG: GDSL-type esterase/lipase family protein [Myxococcales bacterium]|nr:GDSL-type esterase/lipase family protein [Myxococcales bacterium]
MRAPCAWTLPAALLSTLSWAFPACSGDVARSQHAEATAVALREPIARARPGPVSRDHEAPPAPEAAGDAPADEEPSAGDGPGEGKPLGGAVPIEDARGGALSGFHAALGRAERGEGQARIAFYGASHVASDMFTGLLRQRLQARFGEAGPGFVLPAKPWRWYRHGGIKIERSRFFEGARVRARAPKDDRYGLAGVALDAAADKYARGLISTRASGGLEGTASHFELYYMMQPEGGTFSVFIDGKREKNLRTKADEMRPAYVEFEVAEGHHSFELRTHGNGPVRVYGVAIERKRPGVILDTLGIPGSRARYHLHWDDAVYREQLARRRPDLVVLAYGTNESGDDDVPIERYEARLRSVLQRIGEVVPEASCLLVGPSDRPVRGDDGSVERRPRTGQLVESQRKLATEMGCGFFDLVEFMGGEMSMLRWIAAKPPLGAPDHVHFTRRGYERLGEVLYGALMAGYDGDGEAPAETVARP